MRFEIGPSPDVPAVPPAEVLDAVGTAARRAEQLAGDHRELHFEHDATTGRVAVHVRDLRTGTVVRTIPAAKALDVLSGEALQPSRRLRRSEVKR